MNILIKLIIWLWISKRSGWMFWNFDPVQTRPYIGQMWAGTSFGHWPKFVRMLVLMSGGYWADIGRIVGWRVPSTALEFQVALPAGNTEVYFRTMFSRRIKKRLQTWCFEHKPFITISTSTETWLGLGIVYLQKRWHQLDVLES